MAREEISRQNFSSGELSPNMNGRIDLPIYHNGCARCKNFIVEPQGNAVYRPGFKHVHHTRLYRKAVLIEAEFLDGESMVLEFTDNTVRFFTEDGPLLGRNNKIEPEENFSITNISNATTMQITLGSTPSTEWDTGKEFIVNGVEGMPEVNGKSYLVKSRAGAVVDVADLDGNDVNSSGFGTYTSGGTASQILEMQLTLYREEDDLTKLTSYQYGSTIYFFHPRYDVRRLDIGFSNSRFNWVDVKDGGSGIPPRTADPFWSTSFTVSSVTLANPAVFTTSVAHGFSVGDQVFLDSGGGLIKSNTFPDYGSTTIWFRSYIVNTTPTTTTFTLKTFEGVVVDTSSGWSAYTASSIEVTKLGYMPTVGAIYESRLWHGGMRETPGKVIASRSPDSNSDPRFDDFTTGTDADHAVDFTIPDIGRIQWMQGNRDVLIVGGSIAETKLSGAENDTAITPTNIRSRRFSVRGSLDVKPVELDNIIAYVQHSGISLRTIQYDFLNEDVVSVDRNTVSNTILLSGVRRLTKQLEKHDIIWGVRLDDKVVGLSVYKQENIYGWHQHETGKEIDVGFFWLASTPRVTNTSRVWAVVNRTVQGVEKYYIEKLSDYFTPLSIDDFFTGAGNEAADKATYLRAMREAQKQHVHLDGALTYDGTQAGVDASATLTPGATTGSGITFTTSADVFASSDVGRELWKKAINGDGTGRATITSFTDAQNVDCTITEDFDSTAAMAAGDWYITTDAVTGLDHLEGRSCGVVTDGAVHDDETVSGGSIGLDYQASVVHVGLKYEGFLQPMALEFGGTTGTPASKEKHTDELAFRFLESLGAEIGTHLYRAKEVKGFETETVVAGTPQPLFTGTLSVPTMDTWEKDKLVYVRQSQPLPCTVQMLVAYGETDND